MSWNLGASASWNHLRLSDLLDLYVFNPLLKEHFLDNKIYLRPQAGIVCCSLVTWRLQIVDSAQLWQSCYICVYIRPLPPTTSTFCPPVISLVSYKDIQIPSKHNKIYYTLPLLDYMFRLLRDIIRPSSELIQDYLIPSALWDPVALTIVGAIVLWVHVCYYSVYGYLCYYITM